MRPKEEKPIKRKGPIFRPKEHLSAKKNPFSENCSISDSEQKTNDFQLPQNDRIGFCFIDVKVPFQL
ncbi:hypothetical protein QL285_004894 [Trifolium repens]|nr:hypothetical protein QL285_004894 [Trifolium repens]